MGPHTCNVATSPCRDDHLHWAAHLITQLEVCVEEMGHLDHNAAPVNGVDRNEVVRGHQLWVAKTLLDGVVKII